MTPALRDLTEAAILVDYTRALLLEANLAGRGALGLADTLTFPVALDVATPALRDLRRFARSGSRDGSANLTFWTANGVCTWRCTFRLLEAGEGSAVVHAMVRLGQGTVATNKAGAAATRLDGGSDGSRCESAGVPPAVVSRLAHELRSPLAAILTTAELMAHDQLGPPGSARAREYLVGIRDSARHMLAVLDAMLIAPSEPAERTVDLAGMAREVVRSLGPLSASVGVRLDLDAPAGAVQAHGEATAVRQMLFNLASNAIRHAGAGSSIVVRTGREVDDTPWLEVEDDGPGIPAEVLSRVLAVPGSSNGGQRGAGAVRNGIGLPLTRELAEGNRAMLAISSESGRGTRIRLTFEAVAAASEREAAAIAV